MCVLIKGGINTKAGLRTANAVCFVSRQIYSLTYCDKHLITFIQKMIFKWRNTETKSYLDFNFTHNIQCILIVKHAKCHRLDCNRKRDGHFEVFSPCHGIPRLAIRLSNGSWPAGLSASFVDRWRLLLLKRLALFGRTSYFFNITICQKTFRQ